MRALVVGAGAVGARAARQLVSIDAVSHVGVCDTDDRRAAAVVESLGSDAAFVTGDVTAASLEGVDTVVLAQPGDHRRVAELAIERGADVVSTSDAMSTVKRLLDLDAEATERGRTVVVGGGFSPGLTCVLARHAAEGFDEVDEVHVAKVGTGGPSCARQHHRALSDLAVDWRDGAWARRAGGSGRELVWFPDPVRGVDCYRAGLPDALLLVPAFPDARRITARLGANRRDRLTSWLPMLRPPHPEGGPGAVRVEVRGTQGAAREVRVLGAVDRPAVGAGAVAAVAAWWAVEGRFVRPGAAGLAVLLPDTVPFLAELSRRGVRAAVFEGVSG
ncbi:MAG TPA: saccharopine dehydrogenase NADP-binding domain-containing protein [Acidimicrobiales bacterium]|jgi:saccharopine dehydrogenase-like NADP-dependent oxidoreductase|nr:saccharopine dehydrogenase NADP-binding domain-containing protein [Acidimicrobiales bacterium]